MIASGSPTRAPASRSSSTTRSPRLLHRLARELGVPLPRRRIGRVPVGRVGDEPAVATQDAARRELQLAPPDDVGDVAERADHRDAGALVGLGEAVREDGHAHAEQRRGDLGAEARLEPLVVGVGDERHARRDELGAGRVDEDVVVAVGAAEAEPVVRARLLPVLELGLRDRSAVVDVPERRGLRLVRLATDEHAQERALRHPLGALADRRVRERPVDGERRAGATCPRTPARRSRSAARTARRSSAARSGSPASPASRAARSRGRTAASGRSGPRRSSGPGARWPGRCRPTPSGRRPRGPACAGSGPARRSGRTRTPSPCGATRSPSAAACRRRRSRRGPCCGRTRRCPRRPSARSTCPRGRRARASPGRVTRSRPQCTERPVRAQAERRCVGLASPVMRVGVTRSSTTRRSITHARRRCGSAGRTSPRAAPLRGWPAARGRRCRASAPRRRRPRARRR